MELQRSSQINGFRLLHLNGLALIEMVTAIAIMAVAAGSYVYSLNQNSAAFTPIFGGMTLTGNSGWKLCQAGLFS